MTPEEAKKLREQFVTAAAERVARYEAMVGGPPTNLSRSFEIAEDGRHSNPGRLRMRGDPCEFCGEPVPEDSRYSKWCNDAHRKKALRRDGLL